MIWVPFCETSVKMFARSLVALGGRFAPDGMQMALIVSWSLQGSPFAEALAGSASRATATSAAATAALANDVVEEKDGDDDGRHSRTECDDRRQQPEGDVAHPEARSPRTTVNGVPCGGRISKRRPQWPTITSAGAERL